MAAASRQDWFDDEALLAAQARVAAEAPLPWRPPTRPLRAAGCFVAFRRGEAGPGAPGDRAWVGAALVEEGGPVLRTVVVAGEAGDRYAPGMLARREGPMLLDALEALDALDTRDHPPDVLLVDATGRDHPRRAGLALHLGAACGLPSVGVTHRALVAIGEPPPEGAPASTTSPLTMDGEEVAAWVTTQPGVRPVVAHAGWRTDVATAVEVVLRCTGTARTPEPLRVARTVARKARTAHGDRP